jgi:DNA topoisomerase-1
MSKNLVIVESPAKAKTIEGFLGKDFKVKSSMGHVMDLNKKKLSVDIDKDFEPEFEISPDKKKIVNELKKLAKESDFIWLASDEDREGEAIAWHLFNALKLDESKTKRIVFHEITKEAISKAIENPRSIDKNLVSAQFARRVLDRLVGYKLSPLLWKKVKPALSAGRVQSVAVRLIVEREEEIQNFKSTSFFKVVAEFELDGRSFTAEYPVKFAGVDEAKAFLEKEIGANYEITSVEKKPSKKSPSAPFTTSTLQQEASRKLGFPVAVTMRVAQSLYESGKITYMRTDSVNLSDFAINKAKEVIEDYFGSNYSKIRKYTTKSKGAQEAHEAIRPTYLENQTIDGTNDERRLYKLIWQRTIASQMADAKIERTVAKIKSTGVDDLYVANGEVIKFDGFLKVYKESSDEEQSEQTSSSMLPPMKKGDKPLAKRIEAKERFTKSPPRYAEASLVKKLEELGIGRPSTYAPTISTIINRGYVVKENRPAEKRKVTVLELKENKLNRKVVTENINAEKAKLFPTDIGILVNKFLIKYFPDIVDYNFTATVEKEFDEIAAGKKIWNKIIKDFYGEFNEKIEEIQKNSGKFSGERLLGVDPVSGKNVYVKLGRFGPIAQIGDTESEEKPKFAGLRKGQSIETITLDEALKLFDFPRILGKYEDEEVSVGIGRFGPYIKHGKKFVSLKKDDDPANVTFERAVELIEEKRKAEKEKIIKTFDEDPDVQVLNGRYGAYLVIKKQNYKIPKGTDPALLSLEECYEIAKDPKNLPKKRFPKKK